MGCSVSFSCLISCSNQLSETESANHSQRHFVVGVDRNCLYNLSKQLLIETLERVFQLIQYCLQMLHIFEHLDDVRVQLCLALLFQLGKLVVDIAGLGLMHFSGEIAFGAELLKHEELCVQFSDALAHFTSGDIVFLIQQDGRFKPRYHLSEYILLPEA